MIGMIIWAALAYFYWSICQAGSDEDRRCGWK